MAEGVFMSELSFSDIGYGDATPGAVWGAQCLGKAPTYPDNDGHDSVATSSAIVNSHGDGLNSVTTSRATFNSYCSIFKFLNDGGGDGAAASAHGGRDDDVQGGIPMPTGLLARRHQGDAETGQCPSPRNWPSTKLHQGSKTKPGRSRRRRQLKTERERLQAAGTDETSRVATGCQGSAKTRASRSVPHNRTMQYQEAADEPLRVATRSQGSAKARLSQSLGRNPMGEYQEDADEPLRIATNCQGEPETDMSTLPGSEPIRVSEVSFALAAWRNAETEHSGPEDGEDTDHPGDGTTNGRRRVRNPRPTRRPCKGKRSRLKNAMSKILMDFAENPATFDLGSVQLPPAAVMSEQLRDWILIKLMRAMEIVERMPREEINKEALLNLVNI